VYTSRNDLKGAEPAQCTFNFAFSRTKTMPFHFSLPWQQQEKRDFFSCAQNKSKVDTDSRSQTKEFL
jgi:hypothetical protein